MALLSNINFYFDCNTRLCLRVPAKENIFLHKNVSNLQGILGDIPIEFHGFTSRINSKGYHSLVPGLIPIFFRDGMGPFKYSTEHFLLIAVQGLKSELTARGGHIVALE